MRLAAVTICVIALTALSAGAASARSSSSWYWTPGACKSELQTYGVQFGNTNRSFNVSKAYCVGLHNHCWLNNGLRRYKVFATVMRSYDGVVRTMLLTVTGKKTWTGARTKIVASNMSLTDFNLNYGPAAWSVASVENQGGCFDIHP